AAAGVEIARHTTVADRADAIRSAVAEALARTGAVLTTGGLGPTRDDVTKTVVAELLGRPLRLDDALLRGLEERFRRLGRWPMPDVNRSQAMIPEEATVLPNPRGTAPGLWIDGERGLVVLLPGVPREMRGLLVEEVLPRLVARQTRTGGATAVVLSRSVRTTGIPESALAERLRGVEEEIAPLTLAYLPSEDGVDLRVTAWALPREDAERRLEAAATLVRVRGGDHCYGDDGADLAAVVLDAVRARRGRLAVAESCTGGLLGARLTAVPGASDVFVGGVVAYANGVKTDLLGVPSDIVVLHGWSDHSGRWTAVAERLRREGFAAYALDWRGHGRSSGRRGHLSRFSQLMGDLQAFRRVVRKRTAAPQVLLGLSFGGLVAL